MPSNPHSEVAGAKPTPPSEIDLVNLGAEHVGRRSKRRTVAQAISTGRWSLRFNLRLSCRVASWNSLSLRDNLYLSLLSRLDIGVAALSKVGRPKSGEISVGVYMGGLMGSWMGGWLGILIVGWLGGWVSSCVVGWVSVVGVVRWVGS